MGLRRSPEGLGTRSWSSGHDADRKSSSIQYAKQVSGGATPSISRHTSGGSRQQTIPVTRWLRGSFCYVWIAGGVGRVMSALWRDLPFGRGHASMEKSQYLDVTSPRTGDLSLLGYERVMDDL